MSEALSILIGLIGVVVIMLAVFMAINDRLERDVEVYTEQRPTLFDQEEEP